jgi:hypothetical protein
MVQSLIQSLLYPNKRIEGGFFESRGVTMYHNAITKNEKINRAVSFAWRFFLHINLNSINVLVYVMEPHQFVHQVGHDPFLNPAGREIEFYCHCMYLYNEEMLAGLCGFNG